MYNLLLIKITTLYEMNINAEKLWTTITWKLWEKARDIYANWIGYQAST